MSIAFEPVRWRCLPPFRPYQELVYRAYAPSLDVPFEEVMGRKTLKPDAMLKELFASAAEPRAELQAEVAVAGVRSVLSIATAGSMSAVATATALPLAEVCAVTAPRAVCASPPGVTV